MSIVNCSDSRTNAIRLRRWRKFTMALYRIISSFPSLLWSFEKFVNLPNHNVWNGSLLSKLHRVFHLPQCELIYIGFCQVKLPSFLCVAKSFSEDEPVFSEACVNTLFCVRSPKGSVQPTQCWVGDFWSLQRIFEIHTHTYTNANGKLILS